MPPKEAGSGLGSASKAPSSATDGSVNHVRVLLERNNIYIEKFDAEVRGDQLIKKARTIVKGARKSIMTSETAEQLRRLAIQHETDNELTFLVNVWGVLLNDERWAKADNDVDADEAIQWIEKAWAKDYLKCNWGADFTTGSIPPLEFGDDIPESLIKGIPKVKNPKPDLTYGLTQEAFTKTQQMVNSSYGARLSVNLDHPGLCVEAKSAGAPIAEAVNQCARAGSATVYLKRKFNKLAEDTSEEEEEADNQSSGAAQSANHAEQSIKRVLQVTGSLGRGRERTAQITGSCTPQDTIIKPDENSFTFSLALDPHLAQLFVNWAEEEYSGGSKKATVRYQMNMLDDYTLTRPQEWVKLRRDMDNILDWIVGIRQREVGDLCYQIALQGSKNKKRKL